MEAIQNANLTLNPEKCRRSEIKFLGMLFTSEGIKNDSEKCNALENIKLPKVKDEPKSFICMIQTNSNFNPSFVKVVALLLK